MIPQSFLEELKLHCDIESVVSSYVALRPRGRTRVGLCPFHSEKTPSFTVYPENGSFYCFGCGAGGDAVTFIRRIENLEYPEALRFLAQRAGLPMPEEAGDDRAARLRGRILEMNREAARFFHSQLTGPGGRAALEYLTGRGLSPGLIRRFGLGYSPDAWDALTRALGAAGFSPEEMEAGALARRGQRGGLYDVFRGRVMFPIIDLRGNVIGFGGRVLQGSGPKYYNSPDTPVFKKTRNLFALNFAKAHPEGIYILCEGYMDVISLHQAGFSGAVASLGTALTADQARLLSGYTQEAVLAYDSDDAGQKATRRAIRLLDEVGLRTRILQLDGAKDPDEYLQKYGNARFKRLLEASQGALEYELAKIRAQYDGKSDSGRVAILRESIGLLAQLSSPVEQDVYAGRLAEELSVGKDAVLDQLRATVKRRRRAAEKKEAAALRPYNEGGGADQLVPERLRNRRAVTAEEHLLAALLYHPDLWEWASGEVTEEDFCSGFHRRVFALWLGDLRAGGTGGLAAFEPHFTVEEMGRVARLLSWAGQRRCAPEQAADALAVMRGERRKKSDKDIAAMDDAAWNDYIKTLQQKKK